MDINELHTQVLQLRDQTLNGADLSDSVQSFFQGAGLHAHEQVFFYSDYGKTLVALAAVALSAVLFMCAYRRRWKPAIATAFAIPLLLLCELSLRVPVVSWPVLNKGENIIVQFPVQNASQKVIVGTQCNYLDEPADTSSSLEATISAFLLPAALTLFAMGLWQLALYFGKFDFEDVRTIILVMGAVLLIYFGAWTMISWQAETNRRKLKQEDNAASAAILTRLALDMAARDIRPESTWVSIVFFGGRGGEGAAAFARKLSRKQKTSIETLFIGLHGIDRGGELEFLLPLIEQPKVSIPDRGLMRIVSSVCAAARERAPECVISPAATIGEFAQAGFPSVTLTALPPSTPQTDSAGGGESSPKLSSGLRLLRDTLLKIDAEQLRRRAPAP